MNIVIRIFGNILASLNQFFKKKKGIQNKQMLFTPGTAKR